MTKQSTGKAGPQYAAAPSAHPIMTDAEADLAGRELRKIADTHGVDDFRTIDKALVFEVVDADPDHPLRTLRAFDGWDIRKAARKHWIDLFGKIINGIRRLNIDPQKNTDLQRMSKTKPDWITIRPRDLPVPSNGQAHRKKMCADDVKDNAVAHASAIRVKVRSVDDAVCSLEDTVDLRSPAPPGSRKLVDALRAALDEYQSRIDADAAE